MLKLYLLKWSYFEMNVILNNFWILFHENVVFGSRRDYESSASVVLNLTALSDSNKSSRLSLSSGCCNDKILNLIVKNFQVTSALRAKTSCNYHGGW